MNASDFLHFADYAEIVACLVALAILIVRREFRTFGFLAAFLLTRAVLSFSLDQLIHLAGWRLARQTAYLIYFYEYWTGEMLQTLLLFGVADQLLRQTLKPLRGLQQVSALALRVIIVVAAAGSCAAGWALRNSPTQFLIHFTVLFTQAEALLMLVLLTLLICILRPLRLTFRGRSFRIALGLALFSLPSILWQCFTLLPSPMLVLNSLTTALILAGLVVWLTTFAHPETARAHPSLDPSSRLLRWNRSLLTRRLGPAV